MQKFVAGKAKLTCNKASLVFFRLPGSYPPMFGGCMEAAGEQGTAGSGRFGNLVLPFPEPAGPLHSWASKSVWRAADSLGKPVVGLEEPLPPPPCSARAEVGSWPALAAEGRELQGECPGLAETGQRKGCVNKGGGHLRNGAQSSSQGCPGSPRLGQPNSPVNSKGRGACSNLHPRLPKCADPH